MADLFTDNFNGTNWDDINEAGQDRENWWDYHPAAGQRWYMFNGRAHGTGSGVARCETSPGTADYAVHHVWGFFSDVSGANSGPIVRYNSATDSYYAMYYTGGTLYLSKRVSGSETVMASKSLSLGYGFNPTPVNHTARLEAKGSHIGAFVNGTLQLDVTDTSITAAGYGGMRSFASADAYLGHHVDDFVLTTTLLLPDPSSSLPIKVKSGGAVSDVTALKMKSGGVLVDITVGS